jgi:predicted transposase YdaD
LRQVARKIDTLTNPQQRSNLTAISAVMAGLSSLEKELIQKILRRDLMRESVIYQEWQTKAEQRGRSVGKAEGKAEER